MVKEHFIGLDKLKAVKLVTALVVCSLVLAACSSSQAMDIETKPEYANINQTVEQFLNSEGKFTDEELAELPHMGFDYVGMGGSSEMLQGNYLGIMNLYSYDNGMDSVDASNWQDLELSVLRFQAIFLGGVYEDGRVVMFMGMTDKDGNRVVVPVGRTVDPKNDNEYYLTIMQYDGGSRNIDHSGTSYMGISLGNFNELSLMTGYALVFTCVPKPIEGTFKDQMANNPPTGPEILEQSSVAIPLCRALFNSIADVRNRDLDMMEDADENYTVYDINSFTGVNTILTGNATELYYGNIYFVR